MGMVAGNGSYAAGSRTDLQVDFPETADIETASDDYARRFAGPVGAWMLKVQEDVTRQMLQLQPTTTILDVGGGHAQLAAPLCQSGYNVTVTGSHASCAQRLEPYMAKGRCRFVVANMLDLPFETGSFDVVLSFRLLTHCNQWTKLVDELCRVAKLAVIIDYPTSQGLNSIAPALFETKKKLEGNTRTWLLFRHGEIDRAFAGAGFAPELRRPQFFLPMVLHRTLKCPPLSAAAEKACQTLGLTRRWGSPVIVNMSRRTPLPSEGTRNSP